MIDNETKVKNRVPQASVGLESIEAQISLRTFGRHVSYAVSTEIEKSRLRQVVSESAEQKVRGFF